MARRKGFGKIEAEQEHADGPSCYQGYVVNGRQLREACRRGLADSARSKKLREAEQHAQQQPGETIPRPHQNYPRRQQQTKQGSHYKKQNDNRVLPEFSSLRAGNGQLDLTFARFSGPSNRESQMRTWLGFGFLLCQNGYSGVRALIDGQQNVAGS